MIQKVQAKIGKNKQETAEEAVQCSWGGDQAELEDEEEHCGDERLKGNMDEEIRRRCKVEVMENSMTSNMREGGKFCP